MAKQPPKTKGRKKIFLVDDHPVFREGLVSLLKREADLMVSGEADTARTALTAIERTKPDLVLVDIGLPERSGLELIKDLRATSPETVVLVISMHDESLYAERVLRAGGHGYIMKQEGPEHMLRAIRQVLNGQIYLSARMSPRILDVLAGRSKNARSPIGRLTDREFEVLQLIGQGKDSHVIAKELHVSFKTVDNHRARLKEKLKLQSGTELICYAARWIEAQQLSRS